MTKKSEVTGKVIKENKNRLLMMSSLFLLCIFYALVLFMSLGGWKEAGFLFECSNSVFNIGLLLSFTVLFAMLLKQIYTTFSKMPDYRARIVRFLILGAAFFMQGLFLFYYQSLYLFDNAFVSGGASTLFTQHHIALQAQYYMQSYPNQNGYLILSAIVWKLVSFFKLSRASASIICNVINVICIDTSFYLLYQCILCACKFRGRSQSEGQKTFICLLICLQPFLYIGTCYYYTITLSLPFVMGLIYLYLKFWQQKEANVRVVILTALALAFGALFRVTTLIIVIAMTFCLIYFGKCHRRYLYSLLLGFICLLLLQNGCKALTGLDTKDTAFPTTHWIMMSMTGDGAHNAEDEAYTASFQTKEQKRIAVKTRIYEKAKEMSVADFAGLAYRKLNHTFASGHKGYPTFLENCKNTGLFYDYIFGNRKDGLILYHQVYYLLVLIGMTGLLAETLRKKDQMAYFILLITLGAFLFYLLWETGPQHSIVFLPAMMLGSMDFWFGRLQKEESSDKIEGKVIGQKVVKMLGILCLVYLLVFAAWKAGSFTKYEKEWNHPVASQLLANEEYELAADNFSQEFKASTPFNQVVFQYVNPNENSEDEYLVSLKDSKGDIKASTVIDFKEHVGRSALIWDFETIVPNRNENYQIVIEPGRENTGERMRLITYHMGLYDAYPKGEMTLGDLQEPQDMLFMVSYLTKGSFSSVKSYAVTWFFLICLSIFAILGYNQNRKRGPK